MTDQQLKYLKLLSARYKNVNEVSTEIVNLSAILNLPKGTEHFLSDIHGEDESFVHVLKNASGVIKDYIEELFGHSLMSQEKRNLATLTYYPAEKLDYIKEKITTGATGYPDMAEWYKIQLIRLLQLCKRVGSKYTRKTVRDTLPPQFSYILDELIHAGVSWNSPMNGNGSDHHKNAYYNEILDNIIRLGRADHFIIAISDVIKRLAIDHLHIIGDVYDRGPGPARIMDRLMSYHSIDFQWGNHDIVWMGAAAGSQGCITNVIRVQLRYSNLSVIDEDYGINLVPLAALAMDRYATDPCTAFMPKVLSDNERQNSLMAKMNKAITIIQLKVEAAIVARNPQFDMGDSLHLNAIDYAQGTVTIDGQSYPLLDAHFPTIDPADPFKLTDDEQEVLDKITHAFQKSPKLEQHVRFLYNKGSMYCLYNGNLLFHGCIPLTPAGAFKEVNIFDTPLAGKQLLDQFDTKARDAYFLRERHPDKQSALDLMWYLWCGADSPLFGKNKITTFERLFIADKATHVELKDPYYTLRNNEDTVQMILKAFGSEDPTAKIVNGHVPVKVAKGENPVKANGRLLVIDGGFAKAYQQVTGIAGYTLISNSGGMRLAAHAPFSSAKEAIDQETDMVFETFYVDQATERIRVKDTYKGRKLNKDIKDLEALLKAYELGILKEDYSSSLYH